MASSTRTLGRATVAVVALFAAPAVTHGQEPLQRLTIIAPAAPGGGWDQTARAMQRALEAEQLVRVVSVENVPGAAGTVGLARFVNDPPRHEPALLVTGLVMVGAIVFNNSGASLSQTTPIARLTGEYEVIVVPAGSSVRQMRELIDRFRAEPASVSWGGGSAGGTDHILAGLIAAAAGVDPSRVNYIAFSGGGEALAAVLGGQVTAAISGYSEFAPHIESGQLRALAISAPVPQPGIAARPLSDHGIQVALANWRGIVAPPDISDATRQRLTDVVIRLNHSASWQRTLRERGWSDQFLVDTAFRRFLDDERLRVTRIARALRSPDPGGAGSRHAFPAIVMAGAVVIAGIIAGGRIRSRRDVVGLRAATINRRALGLTALALMVHLALLTAAGFVVASAVLFWLVSIAFGSRRRGRDVVIAVAFCTAVYLVFTQGLNLPLPAGWLATWIR
jgi:putative tricarboxylic transport membrane protein